MKILVTVIFLFLFTGCGSQMAFKGMPKIQNAPSSQDSSPVNAPFVLDNVPDCVVNLPQAYFWGQVNSFEFSSSFGIKFGYSQSGSFGNATGDLNLNVTKAQMDLVLASLNPLSHAVETSTQIDSSQTNTQIGLNIDFNQIKIDPNFYFDTPLAKVSMKALEKGLKNLKKDLDKQPWVGRVIKLVSDDTLILNAGSLVGIQVGDQFEVYNVEHHWQGGACGSQYLGSQRKPQKPVALIQVVQANNGESFAQIKSLSSEKIKRGAEVIAKQLSGKNRYLKKLVVGGKISAQPIQLPGGVVFDLESVINSQFMTAITESGGFVLR